MTTIILIIAWVALFGFRIALDYLALKYEFFGQWLAITTIALIIVSIVLALALVLYVVKQFGELKKAFSFLPKSEAVQEQTQVIRQRQTRDREEIRAGRREERERRAKLRAEERDRIYRAEAFEKRLKKQKETSHEREKENKDKGVRDGQK